MRGFFPVLRAVPLLCSMLLPRVQALVCSLEDEGSIVGKSFDYGMSCSFSGACLRLKPCHGEMLLIFSLVIVGAGVSGLVVANRLSEDEESRFFSRGERWMGKC